MISEREWTSIRTMVQKLVTQIAGRHNDFITGQVIKRDDFNNLVWIKELGDQPIPIVGFNTNVKYYDTDNSGVVRVKNMVASPVVPDVGETVFVVLEMGAQSLPRCLGVVQGRNWIVSEVESASQGAGG